MSMRKILLGVAAGAISLGAVFLSRGKESPRTGVGKTEGWVRAARLAQGIDHPLGVAVQDDVVYFAAGGFARAKNAIFRVSALGGAVETLATLDLQPSGELTVDREHVYFTSEAGNSVLRVAKAGGPTSLVTQAQAPTQLTLDQTHVYFVSFARHEPGGSVHRVAKSGGPPEILASGHIGLDSVVVDERDVYFRSNSGLWRVPKIGGPAQSLWARTPTQNALRLAADATHLYFLLENPGSGKYALARLSKGGGAPEIIGPVVNASARIALSDTHVYFFRQASLMHDLLAKIAKSGGEPETVDGSGHSTGFLTVSGGDVYFTDINTVYRVAK
jgi:hypothetical protein